MVFDFNAEFLAKYDTYGPRYTSYPTAAQFDESFDRDAYIEHTRISNDALLPRPLSVYVHIPFCHSLCYFCACHKIVTQQSNKADKYLEYVYKEISLQSQLFDSDRLVNLIHLGGGTPNFLSTEQIEGLLECIARNFHLGYPGELEISIEIDPRYTDAEQILALRNLGFNRFSIGVQDFSPAVQKAINRLQSEQQVLDIVAAAQKGGESSVSVDLISGLPHQTEESFENTLKILANAEVGRLAIYNFAYLPERIASQKMLDPTTLPDVATRFAITRNALQYLQRSGYEHIGMDHFALPHDNLSKARRSGSLQRNFQGYTTHAETNLVGIGVSAISQFEHAFSQNSAHLPSYYAMLDTGHLPTSRGISLSQDDKIRRDIIQTIMCQQKVQFDVFEQQYQLDIRQYFSSVWERLQGFSEDGLLTLNEQGFYITSKGRYFLRNIAMVFDGYFTADNRSRENVVKFSKTI